MSGAKPPEFFVKSLAKLGLSLQPMQEKALLNYEKLLLSWNPKINLIAPSTLSDLWNRHFLDSAQLAPYLNQHTNVADLGAGGGFPGLILAILRPDLQMTLMESDQRKAAFLYEVTRVTKADGMHFSVSPIIYNNRVENWSGTKFDVICARALAPLGQLLRLARPLLKDSGSCLFLKGEKIEAELTEARKSWHMAVEKHPSLTEGKAVLLKLDQILPLGK